jgi:hypothetical protein
MATSEYWDQILLSSDFEAETAAEGPSAHCALMDATTTGYMSSFPTLQYQ